jgi:predicted metal-dependent phosphoesterase TrpH
MRGPFVVCRVPARRFDLTVCPIEPLVKQNGPMTAVLPPTGRADLHIHPSDDRSVTRSPDAFYAALLASGLDAAVLADHDNIDVAKELVARSRAEQTSIELVVGEEITSRRGHVLGIGLNARVPSGLSLSETIVAIHEQGALAVAAHPLLPIWTAASAATLIALAEGDPRSRPDALEAMHPMAAWLPGWRRRVVELATRCGYAVVGGSDAHRAGSVGRGRTVFAGRSAADLFAAIRAGTTWAEGDRAPFRDIFRPERTR